MICGLLALVALCIAAAVYYRIMYPPALKLGNGSKKIACVGDSITYALGVVGKRKEQSFSALIAKALGDSYSVWSYGLCDRTLRNGADKPFFKEKLGKEAWATDADVVIFMLGSNDVKRKNWDCSSFIADYECVIKHYLEQNGKLIVMLPPKIFYADASKSGYDNAILRDELICNVRLLAQKYDLLCVDLYEVTEHHPEWFPDKLHPNKQGNAAIAEAILKTLSKALDERK